MNSILDWKEKCKNKFILCVSGYTMRWPKYGVGKRKWDSTLHPPHSLPPREAHARSLGQRPSQSWAGGGGEVGEEEHCPPLDGSETWDEADTKIREY